MGRSKRWGGTSCSPTAHASFSAGQRRAGRPTKNRTKNEERRTENEEQNEELGIASVFSRLSSFFVLRSRKTAPARPLRAPAPRPLQSTASASRRETRIPA